jgi:isoleucyl-tRNA synthetase
MSTMMVGRAPFKTLLGHALVRDQNGDEMHKSKGNSIPFEGAADNGYQIAGKQGKMETHPPMGADLVRWMYCRQNPSHNVNFGPGPAEEVRARFFLKLWNTYSFFCNYARLDGYDPDGTPVGRESLTDLDKWILSDLQKLVQTAHEAYKGYDLAKLCAELESFVDDKVSNWYVRRNRRRFWKAGAGTDKNAAYQTLHQVLVTITRICAPMIPFITDAMHQNLCPKGKSSIHLEPFPQPDPNLIDEELSAQINSLLKIVSLGLSARNGLKIKVRQPLAELRVQCASDTEKAAVTRFPDQITEELNVKKVSIHDQTSGTLLGAAVKANMRTLGPKMGAKLSAAQKAILAADPLALSAKVAAGVPFAFEIEGESFDLSPEDVLVDLKAPEGFGGVADRDTQVALDGRITRELALEGLSRDIVRNVQELRKKANLQLEDRIELHLSSPAVELTESIKVHGDTIAAETLTTSWASASHGDNGHQTEVKIENHPLLISLRKA